MERHDRGMIIAIFKILERKDSHQMAEALGMRRSTIDQVIPGWRRGGDEFWKKFENKYGLSKTEIDVFFYKASKPSYTVTLVKMIKRFINQKS